jgi:hypothetical protein
MKIWPVGVELFREDGRTGSKLIVAFCNFAIAPKKSNIYRMSFNGMNWNKKLHYLLQCILLAEFIL